MADTMHVVSLLKVLLSQKYRNLKLKIFKSNSSYSHYITSSTNDEEGYFLTQPTHQTKIDNDYTFRYS